MQQFMRKMSTEPLKLWPYPDHILETEDFTVTVFPIAISGKVDRFYDIVCSYEDSKHTDVFLLHDWHPSAHSNSNKNRCKVKI